MQFERDQSKADSNLAKHGVSFEEAATIFDDPRFLDFYDPDHSDEEHRCVIIGESRNRRLLVVSYTDRDESIRLISAREATRSERKAYEES